LSAIGATKDKDRFWHEMVYPLMTRSEHGPIAIQRTFIGGVAHSARSFSLCRLRAILQKLIATGPSGDCTMADAAALLGTWNITSWKRKVATTGEKMDAVGPDPIGYLNYGSDGRFYALVVSRNRPTPASLPPSETENVRLFDSMLADAGKYTVDHEKTVHHVDASWNQAWTGTDQVCFYKLEGDKLTIGSAQPKDPQWGKKSSMGSSGYKIQGELVGLWRLADTPIAPVFVRYWSSSGHWAGLALNG
jgi:hypothetical protein